MDEHPVNTVAHGDAKIWWLVIIVRLQTPVKLLGGQRARGRIGRSDYGVNEARNTSRVAIASDIALKVIDADKHTSSSNLNRMTARLSINAERETTTS